MCGPVVMEAVQKEVSRRKFLRLAGVATAAGLAGSLGAATEVYAAPQRMRLRNMQDLTHTLKPSFPTFSGQPAFKSEVAVTIERDGYYGLNLAYWEHVGTHMDAPGHFGKTAWRVSEVPVARLIAPVAVLRIADRAARNHDAQASIDDVRAWERRNGRLPRGAAVFMDSGWESRVGSMNAFRNPDQAGVMHFPGFHSDTVEFLMNERNVIGIGVDTLSLDFGAAKVFKTHQAWLSTNRWGLEALANLSRLPSSGAWVFVGAPKVAEGSGGPSRVVAFW